MGGKEVVLTWNKPYNDSSFETIRIKILSKQCVFKKLLQNTGANSMLIAFFGHILYKTSLTMPNKIDHEINSTGLYECDGNTSCNNLLSGALLTPSQPIFPIQTFQFKNSFSCPAFCFSKQLSGYFSFLQTIYFCFLLNNKPIVPWKLHHTPVNIPCETAELTYYFLFWLLRYFSFHSINKQLSFILWDSCILVANMYK